MMMTVEILLPLTTDKVDRRGVRRPWPSSKFDAWERDCARRFGGYTLVGVVHGAWTDEKGVLVADESRCYRVAFERKKLRTFRAFARETCAAFEQRLIFVQHLGKAELIGP